MVAGACWQLIGAAQAQDYQVRVNQNTNLRAIHELTGAVVATVPDGTILDIVGKFNRWHKINWKNSIAWAADWLSYTRLDGASPSSATSARAEIDNCCFVDRQCQSDAEWESGYRAYQNNECPAPAQTSARTPASKPPGSAPLIQGSRSFVRHIEATLNWMQRDAPEWHHYAIGGLDLIVEVPVPVSGVQQLCTALAYKHERKATLETCWSKRFRVEGLPARMDQLTTAAALVHEACHVHRYEAGFMYGPSTRDREGFVCRQHGTGVGVALDPYGRYFRETFEGEPSLQVVRRWCREGFKPELFCPIIQRLYGG